MTSLRYGLLFPLIALLACVLLSGAARPVPTIATFSVVAYDPSTGEVGVAVQSRFFAVGSVVPWAQAGVGAVASQALGNPTYGPRALKSLSSGQSPDDVLAVVLRGDKDRERRQLGIVSVAGQGSAVTYTGKECMAWAGGRTGTAPDGVVYSVQGNILTGPEVVDAMARAMETPGLVGSDLTENERQALLMSDLAGRMLGALLAGQAEGGDSRGMQSAALRICQKGMGYGGYTDVKYDLRVDDAVDPFDELARLLNIARPFAMANEGYIKLYAGDNEGARATFELLIKLQPEEPSHHYNLACALALSGMPDAAMDELRQAITLDPKLAPAATQDPDLTSLREREDFKELTAAKP